MTPPVRVNVPVRIWAPDGPDLEHVADGVVLDRQGARRPGDHDPGHDPGAVHGDRLGASVAELVEQVLDAVATDRAPDHDRDPLPRHGREPGPGADPGEGGRERIHCRLTAVAGVLQLRLLALEIRYLGAQLVVAGGEIRDQLGQVRCRQRGQARRARLPTQLTYREDAEEARDGRNRQAARERVGAWDPPGMAALVRSVRGTHVAAVHGWPDDAGVA